MMRLLLAAGVLGMMGCDPKSPQGIAESDSELPNRLNPAIADISHPIPQASEPMVAEGARLHLTDGRTVTIGELKSEGR